MTETFMREQDGTESRLDSLTPITLEMLRDKFGVNSRVKYFVIPLGVVVFDGRTNHVDVFTALGLNPRDVDAHGGRASLVTGAHTSDSGVIPAPANSFNLASSALFLFESHPHHDSGTAPIEQQKTVAQKWREKYDKGRV